MGNYLTEKEIVNIDSKIISNGIKNEIFASGFYLCNSISIEWYDLKEDEQDAFLEENAWEPFEGWLASDIWFEIQALAESVGRYINEQKEQDNGA